ncbi:hypothetical protein [Fusibacter ferrireducens]|uniref:DUF4435 domain-containing protein n=1 Tax=Fusibacter ferrireducens TaxID=2785058 RepID=A0ABR9ZTQ5_9FIRM|nr:hypothetical protein [Fusibacter ferrireducens]MBF4693528.1 hypothetical protein [Fusibacter ferrireducens]
MNNYNWLTPRRRRRQLFIVEGDHEKYELMQLLLKCYPELEVNLDDIIVYKTNIYMFYKDIEKKYSDGWDEDQIDLPWIISKNMDWEPLYKKDFTNILLIFDYERHDPNFSEEKIMIMQQYFNDVTNVGQLYLNYPMVESYQHLLQIPDREYIHRTIPVGLQPGQKYKSLIKDTMIAKSVNLPIKIKEILSQRFQLSDHEACNSCVEQLLQINDTKDLKEQIEEVLSDVLGINDLKTAKHQLADTLMRIGYLDSGVTYYGYMRKLFNHIIGHNIWKAHRIQSGEFEFSDSMIKEWFRNLKLDIILSVQNHVSRDTENGFIWILNTCVFLIPDYNFDLVEVEKILEK